MDEAEAVEDKITKLFQAYDIDESGELDRDEFVKVEMRLALEQGQIYKADTGAARMTLTDRDRSGFIDYQEFRNNVLTSMTEMGLSRSEIIDRADQMIKAALQERARMGPRFHAGIRQTLKSIFALFDVSGDGSLSPEEWIYAQKVVALEVADDLDEGWVDEAAFAAADSNGDGVLDQEEFLEASFSMFEGVKKRSDQLLMTLQRIVKVLEDQRKDGKKETDPIQIYVQTDEKPDFQSPLIAWQDEQPSADAGVPDEKRWTLKGEVALPLNLQTAEEVAGLIRLVLKLPPEMWVSCFVLGPPREGGKGCRPITLLRGERPNEGNVAAMLKYLCKENAVKRLFVKNVRKRPSKLIRQPRAFLEERETILGKRTGQSWGLDWETQLVGDGVVLPPRPMIVKVGDAVVVEVPQTCDQGEYKYVSNVFMDSIDVLSRPVDENIVPKKSKKKQKKPAGEPDPLLQLSFVAMKEGRCILFVDVGWEDQEEKLGSTKQFSQPVCVNSVARIGPIEVEVEKATGKADKSAITWWNGEKWSAKKGPAKRKKKKG